MQIKPSKVIIVVFFAVSLLLPGVLLNRDASSPVYLENRFVWPFPSFRNEGGGLNRSFVWHFERYWNDNIAFRQLAIAANIITKYYLFGILDHPHHIMGKEGHLFFDDQGKSIRNYQRLNPVSEEGLDEALSNFLIMKDYFERRGIPFFMAVIPDKERVYPEYYPDHIVQQNKQGLPNLEAIAAHARRNSNLNVVTLTDALVRGKNTDFYLYPSVEPSHWNMRGAFIGYQEIVKLLRSVYPDLLILEEDDFTITPKNMVKQIGPDIIFNDMPYVVYDFDYDYSSVLIAEPLSQSESFISLIKERHRFPDFYYINHARPDSPRLLIHGDSYIYTFLLPVLAENFSGLYFIHTLNHIETDDPENLAARALHEATLAFSPDIVLFAMVERAYRNNQFSQYKDLALW